MLPNFHVLRVTYLGPTNTRGSRICITSDRFKERAIIPYNYECNNSLDGAEKFLRDNGFNLCGQAEGKDCYYVISDTFKSFHN